MSAADDPRPAPAYGDDVLVEICERISDGESLNAICKDPGMPARSTVHQWLADDSRPGFRARYELARETQADALVDEILDIADEPNTELLGCDPKAASALVQARRVRIDTRKWIACKFRPSKYADRLGISAPDGGPVPVTFVDLAKAAIDPE